jgi:hypothetical protein
MSNDDLQKWMDASIKATELKFALENILTKDFSPEEMESQKYKQLLDTVDQYLEHVMGKFHQEKNDKLIQPFKKEIEKLKKENLALKKRHPIFNWNSATFATVGAIIVEVIRLIILWMGG